MSARYNLKLYASLAVHLPKEAKHNKVELPLPAMSVGEIIDSYRIKKEDAHLVLVNGVYVDYESRYSIQLSDGDTLAIWPPVAGG